MKSNINPDGVLEETQSSKVQSTRAISSTVYLSSKRLYIFTLSKSFSAISAQFLDPGKFFLAIELFPCVSFLSLDTTNNLNLQIVWQAVADF